VRTKIFSRDILRVWNKRPITEKNSFLLGISAWKSKETGNLIPSDSSTKMTAGWWRRYFAWKDFQRTRKVPVVHLVLQESFFEVDFAKEVIWKPISPDVGSLIVLDKHSKEPTSTLSSKLSFYFTKKIYI